MHLTTIFLPLVQIWQQIFLTSTHHFITSCPIQGSTQLNSFYLSPTNPAAIEQILGNLNPNKATGPYSPRANGAKRRSGRKPGARVTNFVLAELKVVARDR